jgi:zinc protease
MRRGLRFTLVAVFAWTCAPATAATPADAPLAYMQRTLDNGLSVYAIRDTSTPNVSVQMWYAVGGKDDPQGRLGFAHLFEHLMFKRTRNLPAGAFVGLAEDVGGTNDASTEDDYTRYYTTVPAAYLERILFAEADRMAGLVIDQADFASEREVVKNEIRMRVFGEPYGKLVQLYWPEVSYTRLPYARPTLGSMADLDAATVDEARAFHAVYYRPDNAVLVVAGNFDPAELDRWIDRHFAPIARPAWPIPRVEATEPARTAPTRHVVYEDATPSPAVVLSYPVPRIADADTPALAVMNAILSAGDGARLPVSLVDGKHVAQKSASLLEQRKLGGSLAVYAILAGEVTPADGEAALKAELARLRDAPVSPQELARAKNQLLLGAMRAGETIAGKAERIARAALLHGDARAAQRELAALDAVTAADVQRVAAAYLVDTRAAIIHYLPIESAPAGTRGDTIDVPSTVVQRPLIAPPNVPVVEPAAPEARVALPAPGKAARFDVKPTAFRLRNGLSVALVERRGAPLVTMKLVAPGGSASDPPGRAGLASLTADLMTKGTATRSGDALVREIESLGGSLGAGAGWDGASIGVTVRADAAAPALAVLADIARNPRLAADDLDAARGQTTDALDDARQDAMKLARMVASRLAFGDAPYGSPRIGTAAGLAAITRDDVANAYAAAWRPSTATLVIVGDVTPKAARALAEGAFGDWRGADAPAPQRVASAAFPAPRVVVVDLPGATEAAVVVTRPVAARTHRDYAALAVANAALGGGGSSRLNREIRYARSLTYDAGSALLDGRDAGALIAATLTRNDAAAEVAGLIVAELRKLATTDIPAAELDARRQLVVGGYGRAIEATDGLANIVGNLALQAAPLKDVARHASALERVSAAAVRAAAARWFDPAGASIVVVGDAKQFADALRKTYPQLEVIAAADVKLDRATLR